MIRRVSKWMLLALLLLIGLNIFYYFKGYLDTSYWQAHWDPLLNMVVCLTWPLSPFFIVIFIFGMLGFHYWLNDKFGNKPNEPRC